MLGVLQEDSKFRKLGVLPIFFTCPKSYTNPKILKTVPKININTNPNPNLGLRPRTPRQSSQRSLGGLIQ